MGNAAVIKKLRRQRGCLLVLVLVFLFLHTARIPVRAASFLPEPGGFDGAAQMMPGARILLPAPQDTQMEAAKKKREEAAKQQEEAEKQAEEAQKAQEEALSKTDELTQTLTELLAEQELLKQEIDTEKQNLARAKQERDEAEQKEKQQYQAMKERIRFLYENRRDGYLDIFLGVRTLSSLFNRGEYVQSLYRYDRKKLEEYQETRALAREKQEESLDREAELETLKAEQISQQESLEKAIRESRKDAALSAAKLEQARARSAAYVKLVEEKNQEIRSLEAALTAERNSSGSGTSSGPGKTNAAGSQDGPASGPSTGMTKSVGGTERGRRIADYGLSFLGNPYVWGGTSLTNGADCSGFVQSVYKHFGITLPRTSAEQRSAGVEVPFSEAEPGDLVCYAGHIGIYIGNGQIVHASNSRNGIITSYAAYRTILSVRRII